MFFFFKQKTAYEIHERLVGSEMCIRDRFGLVGGLIIQEENIVFIILTTLVKYLTTIPLTYLFYSLYKSLNPTSN